MANSNRVFIAFAIEDSSFRDLLVGQARNQRTPFSFTDMSVKEPWSYQWKTNCRTKIRGCDGLIALVSRNTYDAEGARWEIKCADEENVPIIGLHVRQTERGTTPPELSGKEIIDWTWDGIASFLDSL